MSGATTKLVYADEVGDRIAGFTVRSAEGVELVRTVEEVEATGATAWASSIELLIWLSRTPQFWGDCTESARFQVWDSQAQEVRGVIVSRKGCETPFRREELH